MNRQFHHHHTTKSQQLQHQQKDFPKEKCDDCAEKNSQKTFIVNPSSNSILYPEKKLLDYLKICRVTACSNDSNTLKIASYFFQTPDYAGTFEIGSHSTHSNWELTNCSLVGVHKYPHPMGSCVELEDNVALAT
ncbi:hypothetical protein AVEN_26301-1 [Araneus ventricosus]|uniref:Uncharacterized protein n=1 Tax=Araneus ventricosus TaxID=182803 RepID=A0A4Y2AM33_ARAVE|nr:hypothetical protein AVEN_26301-1 [Araneus ventricosus]